MTPSPTISSVQPSPVDFHGDLIRRTTGRGSRQLGDVRLSTDAQLYLQCLGGGVVKVGYGAAGESDCPPDGVPLLAQISAAQYPATISFEVVGPSTARWVLAVDSHLVPMDS